MRTLPIAILASSHAREQHASTMQPPPVVTPVIAGRLQRRRQSAKLRHPLLPWFPFTTTPGRQHARAREDPSPAVPPLSSGRFRPSLALAWYGFVSPHLSLPLTLVDLILVASPVCPQLENPSYCRPIWPSPASSSDAVPRRGLTTDLPAIYHCLSAAPFPHACFTATLAHGWLGRRRVSVAAAGRLLR
jgi:hypothetical protein